MNKSIYFENGWLKKEYLWPLRQQITLGSLYTSHYENSFGIDPHKVQDFFDSFWESYCEELADEDNLLEEAKKAYREMTGNEPTGSAFDYFYLDVQREKYDNLDTLHSWYGCYCDSPLPPKTVNVDIFRTVHRSIQVIASSEEEAEEIVNEMLNNGEIPISTFEVDDCEWELDTSYQPD